MPYNWNGDYVPSKADRSTDILGQKEIGGVGQFIYYPSYNVKPKFTYFSGFSQINSS